MTNDEIQEIVAKADDEYDRLKDKVHEQYDEIKRLNNIINELEKWLKEEKNKLHDIRDIGEFLCEDIINKIKELKGSDKE